MAHSLRQASRADIVAIHEVRMSVRENQLTRSVISERDYIDHLETIGRGWVIEVADRIVAVVVGNTRNGNIWGLFVHPEFERRGFGRRLLDTAVDWAVVGGADAALADNCARDACAGVLRSGWMESSGRD